jgi:hypothetical protein
MAGTIGYTCRQQKAEAAVNRYFCPRRRPRPDI